MSSLTGYLNKKVVVVTVDGDVIVGILASYDQATNLVLEKAEKRIVTPDSEGKVEDLGGAYLLRGDVVVLCGQLDVDVDSKIDWSKVRGKVIGTTKHKE